MAHDGDILDVAVAEEDVLGSAVALLFRVAAGGLTARVPYFFLDRYIPSYLAQWRAFTDAVRNGDPVPVSGADGRAPLVIGLAAKLSVREERPVSISEFN